MAKENEGFLGKLLGTFARYDFMCRFFPGIALYALFARFTKFSNYAKPNFLLDIVIACAVGVCIDALGSYIGEAFITQKTKRKDYCEYRENCGGSKNIYMLEIRRVMCRNIAVMFAIFFFIKIYESFIEGIFSKPSNVISLCVIMCGIYVCRWKSCQIDYYKQLRMDPNANKQTE